MIEGNILLIFVILLASIYQAALAAHFSEKVQRGKTTQTTVAMGTIRLKFVDEKPTITYINCHYGIYCTFSVILRYAIFNY